MTKDAIIGLYPRKELLSPISKQDALDLLQKLISEKSRVQAMFVGRGGVKASASGTVQQRDSGLIAVTGIKLEDGYFAFGLQDVSTFMYGDDRAFKDFPPDSHF